MGEDNYPLPHCGKCGAEALLKDGRHGRFFACPNWPKCEGETCSHSAWLAYHRSESAELLMSVFEPLRGDNPTRRFIRNMEATAKRDPLSPEARLLNGPEEDGYSDELDEEWHELDNCFKPD